MMLMIRGCGSACIPTHVPMRGNHPMTRPRELRRSKLRDRNEADATNNRIGCWTRGKIEQMDAKFVAAMQRAMLASRPQVTLPPRQRHQTRR
jgi:hypothetical protein